MNKIFLIFKREYLTKVRKKSFIIVTLLVPLGIIAMFGFQIGIILWSSEDARILVKDESNIFTLADSDSGMIRFKAVNTPLEELKESYIEDGYNGILYIPKINIDNPNGVKYISDKSLGMKIKDYIEDELSDQLIKRRLEMEGLDNKTYNNIQKTRVNVGDQSATGETVASSGMAAIVGFGMGFLMYIVIFMYGAMIMRSVMEEKTNRIVEIILSSVKPFKLMMGKILGVGAVGLTQYAIWIVLLVIINFVMAFLVGDSINPNQVGGASPQDMDAAMEMIETLQMQFATLPIGLIIIGFLFYFITGYVFYAALYAGLASAINDESDAQTLTFPIAIPIIISIIILSGMLDSPNSSIAVWASIIPFSAPIIMPARLAFGMPPIWQLLISGVLMIAAALFAVWLAAKIYKVGILMRGKKVTFREIGKWLTYS
ncbi:MAG: ABC transporter permease [Chitinophagales bacterium]